MLYKKLLHVSVLYLSYAMFPVDHNWWSTLPPPPPPPPPISLVRRDVLIFFCQNFLQKVSSLVSLSLSLIAHLSLSHHLISLTTTTPQQHNNKNNNPTTNQQQHDTTINNMTTNKTTK